MNEPHKFSESHGGAGHPRNLIGAYKGKGLFITATGTEVGKTTVTGALAGAFHKLGVRVGICKPVASACPKFSHRGNDPQGKFTDEDFVPVDSMVSGAAAGFDVKDEVLMRYMSPVRFGAPLSPHQAGVFEGRTTEWGRVAAALDWWQENCEVLLVEGAGGWYVPLDQNDFMVADLAGVLKLPVVVVTGLEIGTLNKTLLTVEAVKRRGLVVAGLVINRVPRLEKRELVTLSNLEELPRLTGVVVRGELAEGDAEAVAKAVPEEFVEVMVPFAREWMAGQWTMDNG